MSKQMKFRNYNPETRDTLKAADQAGEDTDEPPLVTDGVTTIEAVSGQFERSVLSSFEERVRGLTHIQQSNTQENSSKKPRNDLSIKLDKYQTQLQEATDLKIQELVRKRIQASRSQQK
ncbi:hypothetical protein LJB42_004398 [Komagataella kurtzmanii]|nr:hypothetical protein LJB42_004398 [Komagataella kurtzmanii]